MNAQTQKIMNAQALTEAREALDAAHAKEAKARRAWHQSLGEGCKASDRAYQAWNDASAETRAAAERVANLETQGAA
jgi:hypothetical protein